MTKEIELPGGYITIVDNEDYPLVCNYNWRLINGYAATSDREESGVRRTLYMHRLLLDAQPGDIVDHICPDEKLRNTRDNLRIVTPFENAHNRRQNSNSSSPYKGVFRNRYGWQARIRVNSRRYNLGMFADPREAAQMYAVAARHFFGEYAYADLLDEPTPSHIRDRFRRVLARYNKKKL